MLEPLEIGSATYKVVGYCAKLCLGDPIRVAMTNYIVGHIGRYRDN